MTVSVGAELRRAEAELARTGMRAPDIDAGELMAAATGIKRLALNRESTVDEATAARFSHLVKRRAAGEPLAYLIGHVNLAGLDIAVGPGVFIPRRQSIPMLVRARGHIAAAAAPVVVDLCTGSGFLAIALAVTSPSIEVTALDIDPGALAYARANVDAHARDGQHPITLLAGDVNDLNLLASYHGRVDLVVANPPYVPTDEPLPTEWAAHQPRHALYGGPDGLEVAEAVCRLAGRLVAPAGAVIIEHGNGQGPRLAAHLMLSGHYRHVECCDDQDGLGRFVVATALGDAPRPVTKTRTGTGKTSSPPAEYSQPAAVTGRRGNWMAQRVADAGEMYHICVREGLTGHTFIARDGKQVVLTDGSHAVEFISCSYLGLEQHSALTHAAVGGINAAGVHFSSSRNRMRPAHLASLERKLASIYREAPTICFTSVSNVHLGVLPLLGAGSLPSYPMSDNGPAFLLDRHAHASMQVLRGILAQFGPVTRVDTATDGDVGHHADLASRAGRTPVLLADGVSSMGGLIDVGHYRYTMAAAGGYLYVDDAHGTSILGPQGQGYAYEALGGDLDSTILVGSLSKAFGGAGGYVVLADDADSAVVTKAANPLVFGHSIMAPLLAATDASASLHLSGEVAELQGRLAANLALFDEATDRCLDGAGLPSAIRGARYTDEARALDHARRLRAGGVLILPAFYPTVPKGSGLLRFAVSATHTEGQIAHAASLIGRP